MNMNQLINLVMRVVLRKAVSGGINAGMRRMGGVGKGKTRGGTMPQGEAPQQQTAQQGRQGKEAGRKAKMAMRTARRMGKM
jgi:hypothetical protein